MNPEVDEYFMNAQKWREELTELRRIILDCELTEALKWRSLCYTFQKANIVIIGELNDCCTLSFFKGALLKNANGILEKPGENTRAARVIRFQHVREIVEMEPVLKAYIAEAVEVEKAGLKVDFEKDRELDIPRELQDKFDEIPALETAFDALTPGRQRGYILHFSTAKQSNTRAARIEKYMPQIFDGKGIHDCTCGLSKKMPNCDGSHKLIQ